MPPPPPPPPPSQPKFKPNLNIVPMKKVNWETVQPQKVSGHSIWLNHQDVDIPKTVFDSLSDQFGMKTAKPLNRFSFGNSNANLKVIDAKSAQNILILLRARYKNSAQFVKDYILKCDVSRLSVDFIESLMKCIPMPYQISELRKLKTQNIKLDPAEEFLADLCELDDLIPRLSCIRFKMEFNQLINPLKTEVEVATAACQELLSSTKFAKILKIILSLGNHMNFSGADGNFAIGFELTILTQLHLIKGKRYDQTLLNFLVETIHEDFKDLTTFGDDLKYATAAARIDTRKIEDMMKDLSKPADLLQSQLQKKNVLPEDRFVEVMSSFMSDCTRQLQQLKDQLHRMQNMYSEVASYFGFKPEYTLGQCFSDISSFKSKFTQVLLDMTKKRQMATGEKPRQKPSEKPVVLRELKIRMGRKLSKEGNNESRFLDTFNISIFFFNFRHRDG